MTTPNLAFTEQGSGPWLVLLHGFPLDRRIWIESAQSLGKKFHVLALDLPGFGESGPIESMTMRSLAETVHDFVSSKTSDPFILGGLSMGGYVAQEYAKHFPKTLSGLLLTNTKSAADTDNAKRGREEMAELARVEGSRPVADQMYPKMITPLTIRTQPEIAQRVQTIMNACPPATIQQACFAMRDRDDYTAALSTYAFPTLIVTGTEDSIARPAIAEEMRKPLPHGELSILADAAHLSPLEQPEAFASVVRSFFL